MVPGKERCRGLFDGQRGIRAAPLVAKNKNLATQEKQENRTEEL